MGDLVRAGQLPRLIERAAAKPASRCVDIQLHVLGERLIKRRLRDDHEEDREQDGRRDERKRDARTVKEGDEFAASRPTDADGGRDRHGGRVAAP